MPDTYKTVNIICKSTIPVIVAFHFEVEYFAFLAVGVRNELVLDDLQNI